MMYAKPQDLLDRFGEGEFSTLLGTPQTPPDISDKRLIAACRDAAAVADSYLNRITDLPLNEIPAVLIAFTADIARYRLHKDQIKEGGEQGKTNIRLAYEDAVRWLENVATGDIGLFTYNSNEKSPVSPLPLYSCGRIAVVSSPVIFNEQTLRKADVVRQS